MAIRRLTGITCALIPIVWGAHHRVWKIRVRHIIWRWSCLHPLFSLLRGMSTISTYTPVNCALFTHDFIHDRALWSHPELGEVTRCCRCWTDHLAGAVAAQVPLRRTHQWVRELWWRSVSCRTSLLFYSEVSELFEEPWKDCEWPPHCPAVLTGAVSSSHGWHKQGTSPGPAAVGKWLKPHPEFPAFPGAEGCMLGSEQCLEIRGMVKRASSSHPEIQAGNVHCAPALRQCLLVELKPIHRHSLECFLSQSCFPMLLPCAGTHGCTKPPHLCKGSTGNCCLLGWLLSSCFSYDITVFKLQKRSISELKTWRFFHKSKREILAGHGVGRGQSGTAGHT